METEWPVARDGGVPAARWADDFEAVPLSVGQIRRAVAAYAAEHGADDDTVGSIALAVSEAATNAVLHAFVDLPPGRLSVIAEPGDDCMSVRVIDDGRGMMPRSDSPGLGLGLSTMASLALSCDIRESARGTGTEVRLLFDLPGAQGPFSRAGGGERFELLEAVTRLADEAVWPGIGIERLADLLAGRVADAATIDLIDDAGVLQRIAARASGERADELSRWLRSRVPRADQMQGVLASLRAGQANVIELDPDAVAALAHDDKEAARMASMELAYWVNVPLQSGDQLLGSIGLGLRPERGPLDAEAVAFLESIGARAARALAQTRLVEELHSTRRRLERILGALAEAVTVQSADGRIV
ncbi:MAG: serine/threonine-protein kinase RsbW, partial [Thermoleophilaceae bacterium]|nr:serine/threonine-protein kinase RsbW [Thermoleophilaceae bacterium]